MKKVSILFLFCLVISSGSFAQTTGLWSEQVSFSTPQYPNQTRTFAYRIPTNYSASKKYKVFIALHGQGGTPTSFLTSMWQVYGQTSIVGDAIMIAPSEGASLSNFIQPTGEDDGILDAILARARTMYNIDTTKVYITGFSRGSRDGLKIGLANPLKYRGMLLYTPALLSINEAKNLTSMKFTYTNGKFIPICMTVGANDSQYTGIDAEVQNQLAAISNKSMLKVLPGVGHNVPQTIADYQQCYNFVEANVYIPPTTGVDNVSEEQGRIDIFPNPAHSIFYVGLYHEIGLEDDITTRVYNVAGQKVYEQENNYMNQIHVVNLEGQPSGLYMVEVITPSGRFVKRVSVTE